MTKVYKKNDIQSIKECGDILSQWWLVAFPTETVYGLWADALDENACKSIYVAKWRPSDNPLIVHISSQNDLQKLTPEIPQKAEKLIEKFWPGPLTLVLPKLPGIHDIVTGWLDTIAIRMPANQTALDIITHAQTPIAAPSANTSGKPSPTNYADVLQDLDGKIDAIIDGGDCEVWIESTVLDLTTQVPVLLRPGSITKTQIEQEIGAISYFVDDSENIVAKSPGMKYKHYSPDAIIVWVESEKYYQDIQQFIQTHPNTKVLSVNKDSCYDTQVEYIWNTAQQVGKKLFSKFRDADKNNLDYLIIEPLWKTDDWEWVRNRLKKATGIYIN